MCRSSQLLFVVTLTLSAVARVNAQPFGRVPTERFVEAQEATTPTNPSLTPSQISIHKRRLGGGVLLAAGLATHLAGSFAFAWTLAEQIGEGFSENAREPRSQAHYDAGLIGGGVAMGVGVAASVGAAVILSHARPDRARRKLDELRPYVAPLANRDTVGLLVGGRF